MAAGEVPSAQQESHAPTWLEGFVLGSCHQNLFLFNRLTCQGHTSASPRGLVHLPIHQCALGLGCLLTQLDDTLQQTHSYPVATEMSS